MARNLTDPQDSFLRNHSHFLIDRVAKFSPFRDFLEKNTNVNPVLTPPRSPNCNAHNDVAALTITPTLFERPSE